MITKSKARSASARFAALIFDTKWVGEYFELGSRAESASLKLSAAETIRTL